MGQQGVFHAKEQLIPNNFAADTVENDGRMRKLWPKMWIPARASIKLRAEAPFPTHFRARPSLRALTLLQGENGMLCDKYELFWSNFATDNIENGPTMKKLWGCKDEDTIGPPGWYVHKDSHI